MAVDLTLCAKRVISIVNAAPRNADGSKQFVTTVDDGRRNPDDVAAAVLAAAKMAGQAYCESDANPSRAPFVALTAVTHGATLPFHYGPPGRPRIRPYAGAAFQAGVRRPATEIEAFRANVENVYDDVDHDQEGSSLAGFYDFSGDAIYFTGHEAQVPLATFTDADVASKLPAAAESTVIRLAVGLVKTEGDSGTLDAYGAQGQNDLAAIRANELTVTPVEMAEAA